MDIEQLFRDIFLAASKITAHLPQVLLSVPVAEQVGSHLVDTRALVAQADDYCVGIMQPCDDDPLRHELPTTAQFYLILTHLEFGDVLHLAKLEKDEKPAVVYDDDLPAFLSYLEALNTAGARGESSLCQGCQKRILKGQRKCAKCYFE